jgi:hypothetical protein
MWGKNSTKERRKGKVRAVMIQDLERCKADGEFFRAELGADRGFLITFDLVTEASVDDDDTADGGFAGSESCEPDEFDLADGMSAVDKAMEYLTRQHCVEPSSSHFHVGVWYLDADGEQDYRTGDETRHNYHPTNFNEQEQREIFNAVKRTR